MLMITTDLRHGDSAVIMGNMPPSSIDLIVTDPPYDVDVEGGGNTGVGHNWKVKDDYFEPIVDFRPYFREMYRVLKPDSHCYVFSNVRGQRQLLNESADYFRLIDIITIIKNNCYPISQYWLRQTEFILLMTKGRKVCNYQSEKNWFWGDKVENNGHPTVKPLNVLGKLIRMSSQPGDTILDPFMGSGTTGIASVRLKRNFVGIELKEEWYKKSYEDIHEELRPTKQGRLL